MPLVELRTIHEVSYYSDSNGVVAFREPGLMGQEVFFHVRSHGYEFRKDGFGYRGRRVKVSAGGKVTLKIRRLNIAERLYRVTGAGIYRDSVLAGMRAPLAQPLLNGQVAGSDSVLNAVYRGKLYWVWGDTSRPSYPLGNFQVSGAVSELPGRKGLDPDRGVDLRYFVDNTGFSRPMARMPGQGLTWLTALVPLSDRAGRERLYASYLKVQPPLKVYAHGLAVFEDDKEEFQHLRKMDMNTPFPQGHPFRHEEGGSEYVYFAHPFPLTRMRASAESFCRPEDYECYTCLREGSTPKAPRLDRDDRGVLRYAWRKKILPLGPQEEARLIAAGKIEAHETRWQLRDRDSGKAVVAHAGSVSFNAYRRRWVMIAVQIGGTSFLGEVWYAEADSPLGPWAHAVKVVTHDRYSFYNPKQHPLFDQKGGRLIYFEGTYSHTFSGNPQPAPRYDYNQVMYRLDLADDRLALPVAFYPLAPDKPPAKFGTIHAVKGSPPRPAFFALERPLSGTVVVLATKEGLRLGKAGEAGALFHALPATATDSAATVPLYEYRQRDGTRRTYSVSKDLVLPGLERVERPLCRVWR